MFAQIVFVHANAFTGSRTGNLPCHSPVKLGDELSPTTQIHAGGITPVSHAYTKQQAQIQTLLPDVARSFVTHPRYTFAEQVALIAVRLARPLVAVLRGTGSRCRVYVTQRPSRTSEDATVSSGLHVVYDHVNS